MCPPSTGHPLPAEADDRFELACRPTTHPWPAILALVALLLVGLAGCEAEHLPSRVSVGQEPALRDAPRRIELLVLGGGGEDAERARRFTSSLMAELGREGFNASYAGDPDSLERGWTALYDAVLLHPNAAAPRGGWLNAVETFLDAGGGAILPQTVTGWPHGLPTEASERSGHRGQVVRVALEDVEGGWEGEPGRTQLREAILRAVGPRARNHWEAYAVPPLRYSEPPVRIPVYDGREEEPLLQEPLAPDAALKHWQVPPGFELHLFASEPDIVNPIAMAWDERGRLWVVETVDYPNDLHPDGEGNDVIRILEDTTGDGRADRFTVFADGLNIPTGLVFANGGVIVAAAPRFLFLKDTTGDDRADVREGLLSGWSTRDTHAGPSNLRYGFDNRIWGVSGYAGFRAEVGGEAKSFGSGIYRFALDGSHLEFVSAFSNNSWGLGFSENFDVFGSTANNEHSVHVAIPNRYFREAEALPGTRPPPGGGRKRLDTHYDMHPLTREVRQLDYHGGFSAVAGHNLYTARSFPREYWNRVALVNEPTGHLVHRGLLDPQGSGFTESDGWNLMASSDEWASPVHAEVGPDGAVWVLDWYNFIIQHNPAPEGFETGAGAAYETPLRDRHHGRIYRLAWTGAPPYEPLELNREHPAELVEALRHPNLFWRMTAQRLLVERGETDVLEDLYGILRNRGVDEIGVNGPAVNSIWTLHGLGVLDGSYPSAEREVQRALGHPAPGVRKNALMALPRNQETFQHLQRAGSLRDEDENVRLHAFLAVAELPPIEEAGRALYQAGKDPSVLEDEWLPTALFLAALRHREGFLAAYGEEMGALEFVRLAGRAARGELVEGVDWSDPSLADGDWATLPVPSLWTETELGHFFGVVWYRHEFELPWEPEDGGILGLGPITDAEVTYLNGVRVGATDGLPNAPRTYEIPEGVLQEGRNVLAVQVTNQRRGGGIWGESDLLYVDVSGRRLPLAGEWRYRVAEVWPGGRPPAFAAGVPFARQFLRYHSPLDALVPDAARPEPAPEPLADITLSLSAVPDENRFDPAELAVRAGEPLAIAFENVDAALHNVVVLRGTLDVEEVGALLDRYVADPGAVGRDYVAPGLDVMAASRMLGAYESDVIRFVAPSEQGPFLFVCTVPGHWRTMWGFIRVE